jgi:NAD+ synthase (glutamine-hydrolysing)
MRIGMAQINSTLGDFAGNREKIVEFAQKAGELGCDLVVFPELSLFGYLANDLLERKSIVEAQLNEFKKLEKQLPKGPAYLVGIISFSAKKIGKPYYNTAALIQAGKKTRFFHKELLPSYDVFDDTRHMEKGRIRDNYFSLKGRKALITICEDIWGWTLPEHPSNYLENPIKLLKKNQFDLIINMSASPHTHRKVDDRRKVVAFTAGHLNAPLVYVNMVGGQDELIFDGGSFAITPNGKILAQNHYFREDLTVLDLDSKPNRQTPVKIDRIQRTRQALVLGIRDFVHKNGFSKVHLGLSGGIDSAVVACLASEALGNENVTCLGLPGPYSSEASLTLAREMASRLGVRFLAAEIGATYETALKELESSIGSFDFGVVNENLQSRLRGLFLMAFSNKENSMLLTTGNKSEYATGYATLYGDMCGGLAPIADLVKSEVYDLAVAYNKDREMIPKKIIVRAPTAELRPNQTDQDTLPEYAVLDEAVQWLVDRQKPARTETEKWLLGVLMRTEFKRWQAPPILKVSTHSFGRGRRMPIAHRAKC